jgi:hypothetical protein
MAIGMGIGTAVGLLVDPIKPDMPSPGQPATSEFDVTTAEEGIPVADILGSPKMNANIIWYCCNRSEEETEEVEAGKGGASSEDVVVGYKYYITAALCLCRGPVDKLFTIYRNDDCIWNGELNRSGANADGYTTITIPDHGTLRFYWGSETQNADAAHLAEVEDPTIVPSYRGWCYVLLDDFFIGDYNRMPSYRFVCQKNPTFSWSSRETVNYYDYNIAHAIYYVLTEILGLPSTYLNTTSFATAAETLYWEGRGITMLANTANEGTNYIEALLQHGSAALRFRADGKFHLHLLRKDVAFYDIPIVDEDMILEEPQIDRKAWLDTSNEIKVQYVKRVTSNCPCTASSVSLQMTECIDDYNDENVGKGSWRVVGGCPPFMLQGRIWSCGVPGDWDDIYEVDREFSYRCLTQGCDQSDIRIVDALENVSGERNLNKMCPGDDPSGVPYANCAAPGVQVEYLLYTMPCGGVIQEIRIVPQLPDDRCPYCLHIKSGDGELYDAFFEPNTYYLKSPSITAVCPEPAVLEVRCCKCILCGDGRYVTEFTISWECECGCQDGTTFDSIPTITACDGSATFLPVVCTDPSNCNMQFILESGDGTVSGQYYYSPSGTCKENPKIGLYTCGIKRDEAELQLPCECPSAVQSAYEIQLTNPNMTVGTQQWLYARSGGGIHAGCDLSWSIMSGGGTIKAYANHSHDMLFEAPASNPNCDNNTTIGLYVCGQLVDTVYIAYATVTGCWPTNPAGYVSCGYGSRPGYPSGLCCCVGYRCDGAIGDQWDSSCAVHGPHGCGNHGYQDCQFQADPGFCKTWCTGWRCTSAWVQCPDTPLTCIRSAWAKANGCCPYFCT